VIVDSARDDTNHEPDSKIAFGELVAGSMVM
jgi:hypothetical protein